MGGEILSDRAAFAADFARQLKQSMVRHPLRGYDAGPSLTMFRDGDPTALCHLPSDWARRLSVLSAAVELLGPDEVVVASESFFSAAPNKPLLSHHLLERFRGGDPTVTEALDVLRIERTGAGDWMAVPFTYFDAALLWSEPVRLGAPVEATETGSLDSEIPGSITAGFAAIDKSYEAEEARAVLQPLGVTVKFLAEAIEFIDVGPDDPCKCGSGRLFKDCHGH